MIKPAKVASLAFVTLSTTLAQVASAHPGHAEVPTHEAAHAIMALALVAIGIVTGSGAYMLIRGFQRRRRSSSATR